MKLTFDTDSILYGILKNAFAGLNLTGGVFKMGRPLNSVKEDVVVNTITLSQEYYPQLGASNVNIHVPDLTIPINGVQQNVPNTNRLAELGEAAVAAVRSANIKGLAVTIDFQTTIDEPEIKQHYVNFRISWSIHD
jgi:hypothetical protein